MILRIGDCTVKDAGVGNGRFENGWIKIGSGGGQTQTSDLLGNGDDYIRKDAGIDIPAVVSKSGQPDVNGKVIAWSGTMFTLSVSSGTLSTNYNGGTLNVAGVSATITTVIGTNAANVATTPSVPFVLHDDDDDNSLPSAVNIGDIQESDSIIENRLKDVYVRPLNDGGGLLANNSTNVSFVSNTEYSDAYQWGSRINCNENFWVVYLLAGFQDSYQNLNYDIDSNDEGATWASANNNIFPIVGGGAGGVIFYMETMRDGILANDWRARITVHEIGHNFNCGDRYNIQADDGIMHGIVPGDSGVPGIPASVSTRYEFIPSDKNIIRNQTKPKS